MPLIWSSKQNIQKLYLLVYSPWKQYQARSKPKESNNKKKKKKGSATNFHTQKMKENVMKIEIDLFDGNKLPGVEVHTHINSTECSRTNQLTLTPPNVRRRRWRRRLEADSGFTNGGADLVGESGEASIVGVCGWSWENYGSANGAEEVLHCICSKKWISRVWWWESWFEEGKVKWFKMVLLF